VRNLEGADQLVPDDLMELAMKSSWFRSSRFKQGKGKRPTNTHTGLGYRERGNGGGGYGSAGGSESTASVSAHSPSDGPSSKAFSSSGPATDRYTAMREAFRSQYNNQFRASSDRTWEKTLPESGVFAAPMAPPSSSTQGASASSANNSSNQDAKRAKKSRWN